MFDVFLMDMGGHDDNVQYLLTRLPHAKIIRWTDHLSTVRRAMTHCRTRYAWVLSSCVDYQDFDFLWEPSPWQAHQIHCWPSGSCRFGDTFLIPCTTWNQQQESLQRLEDYQDVNFEHEPLQRLPWQSVSYKDLTLPEVLDQTSCETPYVLFTNQDNVDVDHQPWLWREQPVVSLSKDNGITLFPRAAHGSVQTQIYDYAWLNHAEPKIAAEPLDVVFIGNGEHGAQHHWEALRWHLSQDSNNRLHRIDGVNGRVAAYQAAARASTTDWFFAVFAKLQVNSDFDWDWQPDRWQQPKHYIFHAHNPVNGLIYGHQAMIAYNKRLVLANTGTGLDFTLDDEHEVVPILSGTAYYANSAWTAWRTAFREAIKLRHSLPDVENEYRLSQWLKENNADDYVKWSHLGAQDAMEYYESVAGEFAALRKTYEWSWLATYAAVKRPQLFTQSNT